MSVLGCCAVGTGCASAPWSLSARGARCAWAMLCLWHWHLVLPCPRATLSHSTELPDSGAHLHTAGDPKTTIWGFISRQEG